MDIARNAAMPAGITTALDGGPRILGGTVDMGAYEFVPPTPGDFDQDVDVDHENHDLFESCASGPGVPVFAGCTAKDLDNDGDADQVDFSILQRCFSGENVEAMSG